MTRRLFLTILTIAFVSLSLCAQENTESLPASVVPKIQKAKWARSWWMPRHKKKIQEMAGRDIDLVMLGDSITQDWEKPKGKKIWAEYYGKRNALNLGFSGDKTEHVLWRLNNGAVDGLSPKLVVLMIGTNNNYQRQETAEETALGIKTILDELRTRLPESKILLLGIFIRGQDDTSRPRKKIMAVNKIIKDYGDKKHIFYLNINDKFLDENRVLSKSIMPDLIHPNAEGYKIWAESMEPMVKKLMRE